MGSDQDVCISELGVSGDAGDRVIERIDNVCYVWQANMRLLSS